MYESVCVVSFWSKATPVRLTMSAILCKASDRADPGGEGGLSQSRVSCIDSLRLFWGLPGKVQLLFEISWKSGLKKLYTKNLKKLKINI